MKEKFFKGKKPKGLLGLLLALAMVITLMPLPDMAVHATSKTYTILYGDYANGWRIEDSDGNAFSVDVIVSGDVLSCNGLAAYTIHKTGGDSSWNGDLSQARNDRVDLVVPTGYKVKNITTSGDSVTIELESATITYQSPVYKTAGTPSDGIDTWETKSCSSYTTVTSSDTTWGTANTETWYVVPATTINIASSVTVAGTVNLILKDGCKLTAKGIRVTGDDNRLTIYGQTAGTGQLESTGANRCAGIGGGSAESGKNITINGGTVTATGGTGAAGIGGGNFSTTENAGGRNITINGGTVTATGGANGAGIGGGSGGDGRYITINGGTITATGGEDNPRGGTGIGGGNGEPASYITINGGTVNATGGPSAAGIGSGSGRPASNITITGGTVTATGGYWGAGIGGGYAANGSNIKITGGTVTATCGSMGSGIGGGFNGSGSGFTISGISVKAGSSSSDATKVTLGEGENWADKLKNKVYVYTSTVTSIAMKSMPAKTSYIIGENLDLTGAEITATMSNGLTEDITVTSAMASGFDSTTAGTKTVTVTYEGKTTTFTLTVSPATYSITKNATANGTFKVMSGSAEVSAAVKDTAITIAATPATGYAIDTVRYNDGTDHTVSKDANGAYSFTMPDTAVTVTVTFKKIENGSVKLPDEKQKDNYASGGLASSAEAVKNAVLTDADKAAMAAGQDVNVWVEIKDKTSAVSDADKTAIGQKLPDGYSTDLYLEITLWKQVAGSEAIQVTEVPNGTVKVSLTIPESLRKAGRTYKIIRNHDGVATVIDATVDENYVLTFESDQFSTFALSYQDAAGDNSNAGTPKTGDTNAMYLWLALLLAGLAIAAGGLRLKKRLR